MAKPTLSATTRALLDDIDAKLAKKAARDRRFYASIGALWIKVLNDPAVVATRGNLKELAPQFKHHPDFLARCRRLSVAMPILAEADAWAVADNFKNVYPSEPFASTNLLNEYFKAQRRSRSDSSCSAITGQSDSQTMAILEGDARVRLAGLASESVDCVVTSPPYHGMKDYGAGPDEIGMETNLDDHFLALRDVFNEVQRVLKPDGTAWVNVDDRWARKGDPLPVGNMLGLPDRLARTLQANGWVLRSRIIWVRTSGNYLGVTGRPMHAYQTILMLSKSAKCYYNADHRDPAPRTVFNYVKRRRKGGDPIVSDSKAVSDVWMMAPETHIVGHPTTFPVALAERCIALGCRPSGRVLDPFMGSGTTGVAALAAGMKFTGIELKPEYVKLARERIANETSHTRLAAD